jgi:hypothetical protein
MIIKTEPYKLRTTVFQFSIPSVVPLRAGRVHGRLVSFPKVHIPSRYTQTCFLWAIAAHGNTSLFFFRVAGVCIYN